MTITEQRTSYILILREDPVRRDLANILRDLKNENCSDEELLNITEQHENLINELLQLTLQRDEQLAEAVAALFVDLVLYQQGYDRYREKIIGLLSLILPKGVDPSNFLQLVLAKKSKQKLEKTNEAVRKALARQQRAEEMAKKSAAAEYKQIDASIEDIKIKNIEIDKLSNECDQLEGEIRDLHLEIIKLEAKIQAQRKMFARLSEILVQTVQSKI